MTQQPPPSDDERRAQFKTQVQKATAIPGLDPLLRSPTGRINKTAVAFNVFNRLLEKEGVRAAMYSVLRLTDYRFISVFRFKGGKATSAVHVDRQNLAVQQADEVPDTATYCCYIRDSKGAFVTADTLLDARTEGHAARDAVRAYCGVPIITRDGDMIGTLCHWDFVPRNPEQVDLELLLQVSAALAEPGVVPPYPF